MPGQSLDAKAAKYIIMEVAIVNSLNNIVLVTCTEPAQLCYLKYIVYVQVCVS